VTGPVHRQALPHLLPVGAPARQLPVPAAHVPAVLAARHLDLASPRPQPDPVHRLRLSGALLFQRELQVAAAGLSVRAARLVLVPGH